MAQPFRVGGGLHGASPKIKSTMPRRSCVEHSVSANYIQLSTKYKNDRRREKTALRILSKAKQRFGGREAIDALHEDLVFMCEILDPTKKQTSREIATNYTNVKISKKHYKKRIIDPMLLSQAMYNFLENRQFYGHRRKQYSKPLASLLQTNAINNVILDIDLLYDPIGWVDLLSILLKHLRGCRACQCKIYLKAKPEVQTCTCGHDFSLHGKVDANEDSDTEDILAEDVVMLSKFKSEINQFDRRSANVNEWFQRNKRIKLQQKETQSILSSIKLKREETELKKNSQKSRKPIKAVVETHNFSKGLSTTTFPNEDDESVASLSPRDLRLKKILSPRLNKTPTKFQQCSVCSLKFKGLCAVASKCHIAAVKKYIEDPPKTKEEKRRRRRHRVIVPQPVPVKPGRLKGPWQYWMQREFICAFCAQFFENEEYDPGTASRKELSGSRSKSWIKLAGMEKKGKAATVTKFSTTLNEHRLRIPQLRSTDDIETTESCSDGSDESEGLEMSSRFKACDNDDETLQERLRDAENEQTLLKAELEKCNAMKEALLIKRHKLSERKRIREEEQFKWFLKRQRDFWCDKNSELSKMSAVLESV